MASTSMVVSPEAVAGVLLVMACLGATRKVGQPSMRNVKCMITLKMNVVGWEFQRVDVKTKDVAGQRVTLVRHGASRPNTRIQLLGQLHSRHR